MYILFEVLFGTISVFNMLVHRIVEHLFFFGLFGVIAFLMWEIISPFIGALALAIILATVSYPIYVRCIKISPRNNKNVASFLAIIIVLIIIVTPLAIIGYLLVNEAVSFYALASNGGVFSTSESVAEFEIFIQKYAAGFSLDVNKYAGQAAGWLGSNAGSIFAGTASTFFSLFIAFFAVFYLFRDGVEFTKKLVHISPLPDDQDEKILKRLSISVRAVVGGVLTIAIIQGTLSAFGFWIFGVGHAALLGSIAAFGALIPGIGTTIVFVPVIIFLIVNGSVIEAIGLGVWAAAAVGLIDNLLGPHLMSRGSSLHPFLVLISVLGGISLFGPIGFILGPVTLSFFMVLLELYTVHMSPTMKIPLGTKGGAKH